MQDVVAAVVILMVVAVPLAGLASMAARIRRRGSGCGYSLMGPFDEMWHPAALAARLEIEVQDERVAPAPLPGDRPSPDARPATAAQRMSISSHDRHEWAGPATSGGPCPLSMI